jgi:hypothetical protein
MAPIGMTAAFDSRCIISPPCSNIFEQNINSLALDLRPLFTPSHPIASASGEPLRDKATQLTDTWQKTSPQPEIIGRIAKAMANPLRVRILIELNRRGSMSPAEFIRDCSQEDETEQKIRRQFRQLKTYRLIEEVETKTGGRRRGGVERFYRSLQSTEFDSPTWDLLPDQFKAVITGAVFHAFGEQVFRAMEADTIDTRNERHITWVTVPLDEEGWLKVIERANSLYCFTRSEAVQSANRTLSDDKPPIPTTVGLFVFESPSETLPRDIED